MNWWINSLLIGIVSGLVCAVITWLIRPVPRIKICKDISFNNTDKKYHFKIQNVGRSDISISSLYIILCFRGEFYTIKGIEVPLLHSANHAERMNLKYTYERKVIIDVLRIQPDRIKRADDEVLIKKYNAGQLTIRDFIEKDKDLQLYVGIMARNCQYNTTKFYTDTLNKDIKDGEYQPGKCVVENGKRQR